MAGGSGRLTKVAVALEQNGITPPRLAVGVLAKAAAYAGLVVALIAALGEAWPVFWVALCVLAVGAAGWSLMARLISADGPLTWREAMAVIRSVPTWTLFDFFLF